MKITIYVTSMLIGVYTIFSNALFITWLVESGHTLSLPIGDAVVSIIGGFILLLLPAIGDYYK